MAVSRGKLFQRVYKARSAFDPGTEAQIVVTDLAGVVLATLYGDVVANTITWTEYASDMDSIPHASNYELSISYPDTGEPTPVEYGSVIRKEPRFTLLPPADSSATALKFEQDFTYSTLLGPKWVIKHGKPIVNVNQPAHANALGIDVGLFGFLDLIFGPSAAALFYAPVNGDDISLNIKVRNPGAGKTRVVVCSDYQMTEWLGVEFETGIFNNFIRFVKGTSPVAGTYVGSPVVNTVAAETDTYQIKYNGLADTYNVFKNGGLTPVASYHDIDHQIMHGLGHRYWGASWQGSLLSGGMQLISVNAQDGI